MKKRHLKKIFSLITAVAILCSCLLFNSFATYASYEGLSYESRALLSNDMVFNFWDYYTNYETETYAPPNYFGGFELEEDGTLTVYITDDTPEIRTSISTICGSNELDFVKVNYSFNELYETQQIISNSSEIIDKSFLDISQNKIVVSIKENVSTYSMAEAYSFAEPNMIDVVIADNTYDALNPSQENISISTETSVDQTALAATATSFYPGQATSIGTIGVCATDGLGRKLLITHSHGYGFSGPNVAKTATVGGHDMDIFTISTVTGTTQDYYYDAAYIVVPSTVDVPFSNKVANSTSTRITTYVYNAQLSGYANVAVSAYGKISETLSGTAHVSQVNGTYFLTVDYDNDSTTNGDSGGPIYIPGTNAENNRLLGIISKSDGTGILWTNIRARYEELRGYNIVPYTANT